MRFAKGSPLYSVRCSAYSNNYPNCWAFSKFVNDKNFNGVEIMIMFFAQSNTFLTPYSCFHIYYQSLKLNW